MIKHSFLYFISKLLPAIISILAISVYTRYLNPEMYGLFSLISVVVGILNIFIFQWIRSGLIRFYNEQENKKMFQSEIIYLHLFLLFLIFLPMSFYISVGSKVDFNEKMMLLVSFLLLCSLVFKELFIVFFRTIIKPKTVALFTVIVSIMSFIFSYIFLAAGLGVLSLLLGSTISSVIVLIIFVYYYYKEFPIHSIKSTELNNARLLFKYGAPITFSFGLSVLMQNADKIMISQILGLKENGSYSIAYDLTHNTIYMVLTSLSLAAFPIVLKKLGSNGLQEAIKEFQSYIQLFLFIALPLTAGFISVSSDFVTVIVDSSYEINKNLLILIVISALFHAIKSFWFDQILQISGKTKFFFIPALTALIINVILNAILLRIYGIDGAAIATLISFFISMIISYVYSRKYFVIKIDFKDFGKLFFNTFFMYVLINGFSFDNEMISIVFKVIIGIFIYAIMSLLTNPFNIKEKIISIIFKKNGGFS